MRKTAAVLVLGAAACASALSAPVSRAPVTDQSDQPVRIALATSARTARFSAPGVWHVYDRNSENLIARARAGQSMRVESRSGQLVVIRADGSVTGRNRGPLVVRAVTPGTILSFDGKRYRGEFLVHATDTGLLVVNRLGVEAYLRGVVPLEIGNRRAGEEAAVQAQSIAARSYSYIRIAGAEARRFDMHATVQDQVYGGVDAELPLADSAIAATRDLVLRYAGRIVNTPYHSTCGGSTASVSEVWWQERDEPHLRPVSDRIPGTDGYYCDPSPRFRWSVTFRKDELRRNLERYLSRYSAAPAGSAGRIRGFRTEGRTATDRVASSSVQTSRGRFSVRGNDIRFVLRNSGGAILNSTYFTAETVLDGSGEVAALTLNGGGYGHGIGMCQWGAIGRARAGQDFRTILATYYPGTTVGRID